MLCPIRLPAVRSVTVERNAQQAWQDKTQPVSCRGFVMTAGRIKAFLAEVRQTDAQSVHYTLPECPTRRAACALPMGARGAGGWTNSGWGG